MVRLVTMAAAMALALPATSTAFVHSARHMAARVTVNRAFSSTLRMRLSMISTEVRGSPDTESFRLFFKVGDERCMHGDKRLEGSVVGVVKHWDEDW